DKKSEAKEAFRALSELGFTEEDARLYGSAEELQLEDRGIPEEHTELWNEGVKRGGTLMMVDAEEIQAEPVATLLTEHGAVDIEERASAWTSGRWRSNHPHKGRHHEVETSEEATSGTSPVTPEDLGAGATGSTAGGISIGGMTGTVASVKSRF